MTQLSTDDARVGPVAILGEEVASGFDLPAHVWGFGGVHGGLVLAILVRTMVDLADGSPLRYVTGRFHRPVRSAFEVLADVERSGRTIRSCTASVSIDGSPHVDASATFARARMSAPHIAPDCPPVPPPAECERFHVPPEFVPFARWTEIRPVGRNRPFSGGEEPELTAWLRLVEDDSPPNVERLVVLLDSLAPSYGAILREPMPIPTIEFSVRPGAGIERAESPWVLVRARTRLAFGGWIVEDLDAWTPLGEHLGSATQTRALPAS